MIDTLSDERGRIAALRRLDIFANPQDRAFAHITELAKRALDVPMSAVSLIDEDRHLWTNAHGIEGAGMPRADSFCSVTIQNRDPLIIENAEADPRFSENPFVRGAPGLRSYAGAPLTMPDGYQVGALCTADVQPRTFSAGEVGVLQRLADIVVHELELRQRAAIDPLTGVKQRRAFLESLDAVFARGLTQGAPAALAVLDLDHFKSVNDTYGHPVGDRVLAGTAQVLSEALAGAAIVGRLGGEEFGIVFPDATLAKATEEMERVRTGIAALRLDDLPVLKITASCGLCGLQGAIASVSVWFKLADTALYAAKHGGRDRIVVSHGIVDPAADAMAAAATLPFLRTDPEKDALESITRALLTQPA